MNLAELQTAKRDKRRMISQKRKFDFCFVWAQIEVDQNKKKNEEIVPVSWRNGKRRSLGREELDFLKQRKVDIQKER